MNDEECAPAGYAIMLATVERAPILARKWPARIASACWAEIAAGFADEVAVWAFRVLADNVRVVLSAERGTIDALIRAYKEATTPLIVRALRFSDDVLWDAVLRYHPLCGGTIYRVWEDGYHLVELETPYKLDKKAREILEVEEES
jgi:hypothetical protein